MSPSTSSTPRTCRPGGVTTSGARPGASRTRRRVSWSSRVHTIRPSAVQAGTPGTISSQTGSVSSCSTRVWPLATSTPRIRMARWSRLCTTTSGSCPSCHPALTRYGKAAGPVVSPVVSRVCTGTVSPSRRTRMTETSAFGVPAGGIGHLGGHPFGVRGIGDVPPVHRGLVHPRDEQRGAVRGPPVAAVAVHLLGRDELGQPERHPRLTFGVRDGPVRKVARQAGDPERAVADVGQPPPGRVGARVQRRGPRRHLVSRALLACTGAGERHGVHVAGQREDGHRDRLVGRVGHDPARLLPDPLAPGPLLRRQVVLVGAERPRVGDQAFLPAIHVQRPQARHRVGAALGPQEDDPGAVG